MGFFDAQMKVTIVENVRISGTEEFTEVPLTPELQQREFAAVLLNVGDHGYAKVVLDARSVQAFSVGLSQIEDQLTRHILWQYMWHMVLDARLPSLRFLDVALQHIGAESVEMVVRGTWGFVGALIGKYCPGEAVLPSKERVFDVVYGILQTPGLDRNLAQMFLEYLGPYAEGEGQLRSCLKWFRAGAVLAPDGSEVPNAKIGRKHKYQILKKAFASRTVESEEKEKLLAEMLSEDHSELGQQQERQCRALTPTAESKAQAWEQIMANKESLKMVQATMAGFYSWNQLDLIEPYFDKFVEVLPTVAANCTKEYA